MINKIISKFKNNEIKDYIFWKLGINNLVKKITKNYWNEGKNYDWIYKYLVNFEDLELKSFVEIGSRDALDSINLLKRFNFQKAYIFEPSHPGISVSLKNINKSKVSNKIVFFPFALGSESGLREFYEYTEKIDVPNIGASGFYANQGQNSFLAYKVPVFKITEVFKGIDEEFKLVLIDVEGAELEVLKNNRDFFSNVEYICLEVSTSTSALPKKQNLVQVNETLSQFGFRFLGSKREVFENVEQIYQTDYDFVDLIYVNKKINK